LRPVRVRATRVAFDEVLGLRLLVDDCIPLRAPNHVFESFRLVASNERKATILLPDFLVSIFLCGANVTTLACTALAEEFGAEAAVLKSFSARARRTDETGAQVFFRFRVLSVERHQQSEGRRRMLHW